MKRVVLFFGCLFAVGIVAAENEYGEGGCENIVCGQSQSGSGTRCHLMYVKPEIYCTVACQVQITDTNNPPDLREFLIPLQSDGLEFVNVGVGSDGRLLSGLLASDLASTPFIIYKKSGYNYAWIDVDVHKSYRTRARALCTGGGPN